MVTDVGDRLWGLYFEMLEMYFGDKFENRPFLSPKYFALTSQKCHQHRRDVLLNITLSSMLNLILRQKIPAQIQVKIRITL